jgi:hypothetical protein
MAGDGSSDPDGRVRVRATRLLAGGGSELLNVGTEVVNRVLGAPGLVANLSGYSRRKRLRILAFVLSAPDGEGGAVRPLATEDEVRDALRGADELFRREANTELFWDGWPIVRTIEEPAPGAVLDVDCGRDSWKQDLGEPGAYFRAKLAAARRGLRATAGTVTGYGEPVGVFVVRDIVGKAGCSMGPLSDYVTVDRVRARLIAHELGHCCGLWHTREAGNLMLPAANSEAMTRSQQAIFRNSRHVTFR